MMAARGQIRRRARQRGVGHVASILELAMVMGWFVVMILAEKTLSHANDARRSAEVSAVESASSTSGSACEGGGADVVQNGLPQASGIISALAGLGVPQTRTFAYYIDPMKTARATSRVAAADPSLDGKTFEAERQLACVEQPKDTPEGSLALYRLPIWLHNLSGY